MQACHRWLADKQRKAVPVRYYGANATSGLPVPAYFGRMPNEKGNRYAIHALKDRRATMAGEIVQ